MKTQIWLTVGTWLIAAMVAALVGVFYAVTGAGGPISAAVSVLVAIFLIGGPFQIALFIYDLVDKVVDQINQPGKVFRLKEHVAIALLSSAVLAWIWRVLIQYVVNTDQLMVWAWLQYVAPLDTEMVLYHPGYAWDWALWAYITGFVGYFWEKTVLWGTRRKK